MTKYYCKCLNVCLEAESKNSPDKVEFNVDEKPDEFSELPLILFGKCKVNYQHSMLIRTTKNGSWEVSRCVNCSMYSHAVKENCDITAVNKLLLQLYDSEVQNMKNLVDFSPVFNIIISDSTFFENNLLETSRVNGEYSNGFVELQKQLTDYIEEKNKITEENIRLYVEQQQSALKKLIKRANEDFQILTNLVMKMNELNLKTNTNEIVHSFENQFNDSRAFAPVKISKAMDFEDLNASPYKNKERSDSFEIPPSFDSEGLLFPLDGVEEPNLLEEDDHSEDDLSDTDDSGSRDEGIHIPRRRSFAIAKSLPIRVPGDYDPYLRVTDAKINSKKPNYKQKRNDSPLDIAASIKALANSVHGDTIFGDLPPPRIGSRI